MSIKSKVLIGLLVLLVLVVVGIFLNKKTTKRTWNNTSVMATPVIAKEGKVVDGFPVSLVLDKTAIIESSYKTGIAGQDIHHTVYLKSSQSLQGSYNSYLDYLNKIGEEIVSKDIGSDKGFIYSRRENTTTNILFSKFGDQTSIVITFNN